jgi:hypothetical protein
MSMTANTTAFCCNWPQRKSTRDSGCPAPHTTRPGLRAGATGAPAGRTKGLQGRTASFAGPDPDTAPGQSLGGAPAPLRGGLRPKEERDLQEPHRRERQRRRQRKGARNEAASHGGKAMGTDCSAAQAATCCFARPQALDAGGERPVKKHTGVIAKGDFAIGAVGSISGRR